MIESRSRRRRSRLWGAGAGALVLGLSLWMTPLAAWAQVLEIGDGGAVTVYDRPAVFTAQGATPIAPPPRRRPVAARPSLPASRALIDHAATAAALSPALVEAVAWQESRLRPGLVSRAGAVGEMQLMPATARALGVDPSDSRQNYSGGAAYLAILMRRYRGDLVRALAAYDAGPKAVDHYGGPPPFRETQAYVSAILDRLSRPVSSLATEPTGPR